MWKRVLESVRESKSVGESKSVEECVGERWRESVGERGRKRVW